MTRDELFKGTIERFLSEGYAPYKMYRGMDGKGSAVAATYEHLKSTGAITNTAKSTICEWVSLQERRRAKGNQHFCPDWDLYPPYAAKKGKLGFEPILPGFETTQVTTARDPDGNLLKEYIQQKPEHTEIYELPPDHEISKISAYVRDDKVVGKWVQSKPGAEQRVLAIEAVKAAFEEYTGRSELGPAPEETIDDYLTAYYIADHHLGMFSWREETGFDYDLKISTKLLQNAMVDLVRATPNSKRAIVVSLGDFFHADSSNNQTPASGHALDVDSRRAKVYKAGVMLLVQCIELALTKHETVEVRCLPGNHDPESTPTLELSMWAFFHNNPRVIVHCSSSRYFYLEHGLTMLAGTHNDMAKIKDMPGIMAAHQPAMWGRTRFRYAVGGHVHHTEKFCKEVGGVVCETFQTLAPADSWHAAKGFGGAGRSMTAVTYDKNLGERLRNISAVPFDLSLDSASPEA
jgi:hypothetical protein